MLHQTIVNDQTCHQVVPRAKCNFIATKTSTKTLQQCNTLYRCRNHCENPQDSVVVTSAQAHRCRSSITLISSTMLISNKRRQLSPYCVCVCRLILHLFTVRVMFASFNENVASCFFQPWECYTGHFSRHRS